MNNLEDFLIQYATYNWKHWLRSFTIDFYLAQIILLVFVFILSVFWIFKIYLSPKKAGVSQLIQTDIFVETADEVVAAHCAAKTDTDNIHKTGELLLKNIVNQSFFKNAMLNLWLKNFNEFKISNIVSRNYHILAFVGDDCDEFNIAEFKQLEQKSLLTFTFHLQCKKLTLECCLDFDDKFTSLAHVILKDLDMKVLVMIRFSDQGILLKLCPENVCNLECVMDSNTVSESEKEMSIIQLKRDFRLVLLQTIEMEWISAVSQSTENEIITANKECQVCFEENEGSLYESNKKNRYADKESSIKETDNSAKNIDEVLDFVVNDEIVKGACEMSLFTTESYYEFDGGEESPFHDRFSSKMVGRSLVVNLVKIVEMQELRVPLKRGYCVLELDEPYQRHVSHLISLAEYPIWNQHFVFALNSNSQRLTVELFQASRKCQNPVSLGISVIPMNVIIMNQSGGFFPINTNQSGCRKSWRCDNVAGAPDSKIPSFVMEFQIMKNVLDDCKAILDTSSEKSSHNSGFVESSDNPDENIKRSDKNAEDETPQNTLSKNFKFSSTKVVRRHKSDKHDPATKSVIRKLRNRLSQLSMPWTGGKSKSDDCLDQIVDDTKYDHNPTVPVQPPAKLFFSNSKSKLLKISDTDLMHSRRLSSSLKKMLTISNKKSSKNDYNDKSLEQLFNEMDPQIFDAISNEGFERIMNSHRKDQRD